MGLLRIIHRSHAVPKPHHRPRKSAASRTRLCRFEQIEARELLSVSVPALNVGATYYEPHDGTDSVGNLFYISWNGGAPGTQLTDIVINTHKDSSVPQDANYSPSEGDAFFHTAPGGYTGTWAGVAASVVQQVGVGSVTIDVNNNSTLMTIHCTGFQPDGLLVLRINVDELQSWSGGEANPIVEGAEFDGAHFTADFTAPHYENIAVAGIYHNTYDDLSAKYGLDLPPDNYVPPDTVSEAVYTAGLGASVQQTPLPITLAGTVFEDMNADNKQETGDPGIAGVTLTLNELNDSGNYVPTGSTTTTDQSGNYTFTGLLPGTYQVVETQPDGYLSVGDTPGTVGGQTRGVVTTVDILSSINLDGGDDSVQNDFAETQPASVSGFVYLDANNNGVFDDGETPIGGVTLTLLDAQGNPTGQTAVTDSSGFYSFDNLMPGGYGVAETQPAGYQDGLDAAGTAGGAAHNPGDLIDGIQLTSGLHGKNYDFGELLLAGISGKVYVDMNGDNTFDSGDTLLPNVTVYLLDSSGNRLTSTTTDANGKYAFANLTPGVYGVEEIQPAAYLEGGDQVGSAGGSLDGYDRILSAQLDAGVSGVNYDFYEVLPAKISGYVFQDGPAIVLGQNDPVPNIPSVRDGILTPDDLRLPGITLQLCDATGYPLSDSNGNPITTTSDANGYYEFTGLRPGVYSIVEAQPSQYVPGIDTAGNKGGLVVDRYATLDASILSTLAVDPSGAAIVQIPIKPGDAAVQYNFSEVLIQRTPNGPPGGPTPTPPIPFLPPPPPSPFTPYQPMGMPSYTLPLTLMQPIFGGGGDPGGYSWHLSVIDAGQPRSDASGADFTQSGTTLYFDPVSWTGADLGQSQWILADQNGVPIKKLRFGMAGAKPVTGDWDGSGVTKIGVFLDGLWFLDLNGNGVWDEKDLWIKLGKKGDQPITGDWDGDGKTDIGIFGPAWIGDVKAIVADPGLPDVLNPVTNKRPKNVPPDPADAAVGWRTMKKGNTGRMRSDLIDHVFEYGQKGDIAVTGDWTGNGIYSIGIFRNGTWYLDIDGDGRWSDADVVIQYGQEGDIPVVGDWTGDGISKVGVYRNGTFYLDTNNNRQLDAADKVFELGGAGDKPVVGDWTGDGIDKVGVYQDAAPAETPLQAARQ